MSKGVFPLGEEDVRAEYQDGSYREEEDCIVLFLGHFGGGFAIPIRLWDTMKKEADKTISEYKR